MKNFMRILPVLGLSKASAKEGRREAISVITFCRSPSFTIPDMRAFPQKITNSSASALLHSTRTRLVGALEGSADGEVETVSEIDCRCWFELATAERRRLRGRVQGLEASRIWLPAMGDRAAVPRCSHILTYRLLCVAP